MEEGVPGPGAVEQWHCGYIENKKGGVEKKSVTMVGGMKEVVVCRGEYTSVPL